MLNASLALIGLPMLRALPHALASRGLGITPTMRISSRSAHRVLAVLSVLAAAGHTVAHIANLLAAPLRVANAYPTSTVLSGFLLVPAILIMWLASGHRVRRVHYASFLKSHVAGGVISLVLMLVHAPKFWVWCSIPVALFVIDKAMCAAREPPVFLTRVLASGRIMELEFAIPAGGPWGFRDGSYVFVNVPDVSRFEWHPFTVSSSCMQPNMVKVHIRVHGPGSWTAHTRTHFATLAGAARGADFVYRPPSASTGEAFAGARYSAKSGRLMARIDGPYGAPMVQHVWYDKVILVAAGIGASPISAIVHSLAQRQRRASDTNPAHGANDRQQPQTRPFRKPSRVHIVWIVRLTELPAYEFFVHALEDLLASCSNAFIGSAADSTAVVVDVYLTQVTRSADVSLRSNSIAQPGSPGYACDAIQDKDAHEARRPRSQCVAGDDFLCVLERLRSLSHVRLHAGRPNSDLIIASIPPLSAAKSPASPKTSGAGVGIFFCGPSAFGERLKEAAARHAGYSFHREHF